MRKDNGSELCGLPVRDSAGEKIGTVREVWAEEETGTPAWVSVDTGFLHRHHSYVPLRDAVVVPGHLEVAVPKDVVTAAPRVSPLGDTMSDVERDVLDAHYRTQAGDDA